MDKCIKGVGANVSSCGNSGSTCSPKKAKFWKERVNKMRRPKAIMCSEENAKKDTAMEGHSLDILETMRQWIPPKQNTTQLVEICPLVPAGSTLLGENIPPPGSSVQDSGKKPQWGCVQAVLYELRMKGEVKL